MALYSYAPTSERPRIQFSAASGRRLANLLSDVKRDRIVSTEAQKSSIATTTTERAFFFQISRGMPTAIAEGPVVDPKAPRDVSHPRTFRRCPSDSVQPLGVRRRRAPKSCQK